MKYDIIALVISALVLSGCVYPFDINTDSEGKAGGLVVEGDLLIGDVSTITLSTVQPLDGKLLTPWFDASVWAEDDQGREYHASVKDPGTSFSLDLTDASIDRKYRMHIHMNRVVAGHSFDYSTPWLTVSKAPSFDGIDYVVDDDDLTLRISLSDPQGSGCFRWDYVENWEYHAPEHAAYVYDPQSDSVYKFKGVYSPTYWCWNSDHSTQAGIAIAKSTGGERIVDHKFLSIPRYNLKIQYLYNIQVRARGISQECYDFLHAIQVNSTHTGSLFIPDPSKVVGNIRSDTDPNEVVIGYIEASQGVTKDFYVDGAHFKNNPIVWKTFYPVLDEDRTLKYYYDLGYLPYESNDSGLTVLWVDSRCVDCTHWGGNKTKPAFWPNDHQ